MRILPLCRERNVAGIEVIVNDKRSSLRLVVSLLLLDLGSHRESDDGLASFVCLARNFAELGLLCAVETIDRLLIQAGVGGR
jgi:hypothetical protein